MNQKERGDAFKALHHRGQPFVIPNPWDPGSARMMKAKGFEALATTSASVDHVAGRLSGAGGRDLVIENARMIAAATDLPLSVDLEDCYGADADGIAETIQLAAGTGAVGGSIEDAVWGQPGEFYDLHTAVARVEAAVAAARALPFKFTLTARCEYLLYGQRDFGEIVERLKAFSAAGADVLYAPGLKTAEEVETIVQAVDKPVNVLLGMTDTTMDMADMHQLGVARVSLGSGVHTAVMYRASQVLDEIVERGTFTFTKGLPSVDSLLD